MVELHEGEYCRTKSGFIAKLIEIDDDGLCWFDGPITESGGETYNLLYPDEIDEVRKHYTDICKVIEEGDYINENEITYIDKDKFIKGKINLWTDVELRGVYGDYERLKYTTKDIKTIVTKERMQKITYEVKED